MDFKLVWHAHVQFLVEIKVWCASWLFYAHFSRPNINSFRRLFVSTSCSGMWFFAHFLCLPSGQYIETVREHNLVLNMNMRELYLHAIFFCFLIFYVNFLKEKFFWFRLRLVGNEDVDGGRAWTSLWECSNFLEY